MNLKFWQREEVVSQEHESTQSEYTNVMAEVVVSSVAISFVPLEKFKDTSEERWAGFMSQFKTPGEE